MAYIRKTERAIFVVLTSRSLSAATRLFVPLLLGLAAVWVLMVAAGTKTVIVAQEDYYAVSEGYEDATISVIREMILPHDSYLPLILKRQP